MHRKIGRTVRDAVRTPTVLSKRDNTGEVHIHMTVGENGKFDETGVLRGTPPSGNCLDKDCDNSKGSGVRGSDR